MQVYDSHKQKIRTDVDRIRERLAGLQVLNREVERNVEDVNREKEEMAAELNQAFDGVMARLQGHLSTKLIVLARQKEEIEDDVRKTTEVMAQVERELQESSPSDLITNGPQLRALARDVCRKPASEIAATVVPHDDFLCELVPPYESGSFTLTRYSALREAAIGEATEALYSQELLSSSGLVWRLKVYPNGNGVRLTPLTHVVQHTGHVELTHRSTRAQVAKDTYLSVFVELTDAHDSDQEERPHAPYDYRIEMLNAFDRDRPAMVREYASEFEVGECWGYNRFFRIDDLVEQEYLDPAEDTVTLIYHVRAPTFYQHSRDQARCIEQLRKMRASEAARADAGRTRAARKKALAAARAEEPKAGEGMAADAAAAASPAADSLAALLQDDDEGNGGASGDSDWSTGEDGPVFLPDDSDDSGSFGSTKSAELAGKAAAQGKSPQQAASDQAGGEAEPSQVSEDADGQANPSAERPSSGPTSAGKAAETQRAAQTAAVSNTPRGGGSEPTEASGRSMAPDHEQKEAVGSVSASPSRVRSSSERRFRPPARQPPAPPVDSPRQDVGSSATLARAQQMAAERRRHKPDAQAAPKAHKSTAARGQGVVLQSQPEPEPERQPEPAPEPEPEPAPAP